MLMVMLESCALHVIKKESRRESVVMSVVKSGVKSGVKL